MSSLVTHNVLRAAILRYTGSGYIMLCHVIIRKVQYIVVEYTVLYCLALGNIVLYYAICVSLSIYMYIHTYIHIYINTHI